MCRDTFSGSPVTKPLTGITQRVEIKIFRVACGLRKSIIRRDGNRFGWRHDSDFAVSS